MPLSFYLLLALSYLSGALPWSVWLGKRFFRVDPRSKADGNPGAANAWRTGGWQLGASVLLLDFLKAFIPVAIGRWGLHLAGEQLFWIALAPTVGHAWSLFLHMRGGRGLATWFGVWTALTLHEAPLVMGAAALLAMLLFRNDIYRSLTVPVALVAWLLFWGAPLWQVALAVAQLLILSSKIAAYYLWHRDLAHGEERAGAPQ